MPDLPTPPSVQIVNRIMAGLVAITLFVVSALLVYTGKLTGDAFTALVGTALVAGGLGAVATRRKRPPPSGPDAVTTARHGKAGFLRVPRVLEHLVVGIRLAWAWATAEPRAPKRARRGFILVREFVAVALAVFVIAATAWLAGCAPKYVLEPCGTPEAHRCLADQPQHCAPGTPPVWVPAGDEPCGAAGGVCLVTEGVAHCAPALDGGAR